MQQQVTSRGCSKSYIISVLWYALQYCRELRNCGRPITFPFAENRVMEWLKRSELDTVDEAFQRQFGEIDFFAADPTTFWTLPVHFFTWWKNNIERKTKFASLIQDASYDGEDARFLTRARFCSQAIALSVNIKNHFERVLNQLRDRSVIVQVTLPCTMPQFLLEHDVCYKPGTTVNAITISQYLQSSYQSVSMLSFAKKRRCKRSRAGKFLQGDTKCKECNCDATTGDNLITEPATQSATQLNRGVPRLPEMITSNNVCGIDEVENAGLGVIDILSSSTAEFEQILAEEAGLVTNETKRGNIGSFSSCSTPTDEYLFGSSLPSCIQSDTFKPCNSFLGSYDHVDPSSYLSSFRDLDCSSGTVTSQRSLTFNQNSHDLTGIYGGDRNDMRSEQHNILSHRLPSGDYYRFPNISEPSSFGSDDISELSLMQCAFDDGECDPEYPSTENEWCSLIEPPNSSSILHWPIETDANCTSTESSVQLFQKTSTDQLQCMCITPSTSQLLLNKSNTDCPPAVSTLPVDSPYKDCSSTGHQLYAIIPEFIELMSDDKHPSIATCGLDNP